ncbi:MAG TPA: hypothetical protein VK002_14560 [Rubricoccaceae bacterium]|nr:hypothetical protein [Rubricoccaceae bacterium]
MRLLLFFALAFVLAPAALAQPALPTGDWSGTIEWADAAPVALTGGLEACVEGLKLTLHSEDGAYQAEEVVRIEDATEAPAFGFGMRNTRRNYALTCDAARQPDGTFAGTCRADNGARAVLRLQPPAQATIGCSE